MLKKLLSYAWIKENISMLILIPTIAGGIWQILELGIIGTPYIRFFSVSQLVSDGLLISFICFWPFIIYKGVMYLFKKDFEKIDPSQLHEKIHTRQWFALVVIMLFEVYLSWTFVPLILHTISNEVIALWEIIAIEIYLLISYILLFQIVLTIIKLVKTRLKINAENLMGFLKFIFTLFGMAVLASFFYIIPLFHRSFTKSNDFYNVNNVKISLLKDHKNLKSFELVYFNDKYLFLKVIEKSGHEYIEVKQFEILFE